MVTKINTIAMYIYFLLSLQPSHRDKATNPEVLKWMNELIKFRKQLKGNYRVQRRPPASLIPGMYTSPTLLPGT